MKYPNRLLEVDRLRKEIQDLRPRGHDALRQLKEYYRVGLAYSSNAIEGNSLTESETKVVLEDGIAIGGKPLSDHYEAIGHSEAFDYLHKLVKADAITERDILRLHKLFYFRIDPANAGRYRKVPVFVKGSLFKFPEPEMIGGLMEKLEKEIAELRKDVHPVVYAAALHILFTAVHPFIDGNGRVARLLMNLALIQAGYPITVIPLAVRADYMAAVRKANEGHGIPQVRNLHAG